MHQGKDIRKLRSHFFSLLPPFHISIRKEINKLRLVTSLNSPRVTSCLTPCDGGGEQLRNGRQLISLRTWSDYRNEERHSVHISNLVRSKRI